MRNPRRTSATAAALMVGVALVTLMTIVASSMKSSVNAVVNADMRADFVVSSGGQPGGQTGFSPRLERQLTALPDVAAATGVRGSLARINGSEVTVLAADTGRVVQLFDIGVVNGSTSTMTPQGIAVSQQVASERGLHLGSPVRVQFTRTGTQKFTVQAIYRERQLAGDYVVPLTAAGPNFTQQLDFQVYVKLAPGVSLASGRPAVESVVDGYANATLMDRQQYKAQQAGQVDQLLNLVDVLLILALVIALIGIANTLSLSVHERTRELGMLRAVGMTRRQLRWTVRLEALLISTFGSLEGLGVGILFGWALVQALHSQGVSQLSVPVVSVLAIGILAALAGVLAALSPSRRAARLDVLRAISND